MTSINVKFQVRDAGKLQIFLRRLHKLATIQTLKEMSLRRGY